MNLGFQVRKIRKQRGIGLMEASKGILSPSLLSRFERGEADIHTSQLIGVLNQLHTSLFELVSEMDDQTGYDETFETQVMSLYEKNDKDSLATITMKKLHAYSSSQHLQFLYEAATAANCYADLTGRNLLQKKEIETIEANISSIQYWGQREIRFFGNVVLLISPALVGGVVTLLLDEMGRFGKESFITLTEAWNVVLNAQYSLLLSGEIKRAEHLWEKAIKLPLQSGMLFVQTRRAFLGELLKLEEGRDVSNNLARIWNFLELIGARQLEDNLKDAYTHLVTKTVSRSRK